MKSLKFQVKLILDIFYARPISQHLILPPPSQKQKRKRAKALSPGNVDIHKVLIKQKVFSWEEKRDINYLSSPQVQSKEEDYFWMRNITVVYHSQRIWWCEKIIFNISRQHKQLEESKEKVCPKKIETQSFILKLIFNFSERDGWLFLGAKWSFLVKKFFSWKFEWRKCKVVNIWIFFSCTCTFKKNSE